MIPADVLDLMALEIEEEILFCKKSSLTSIVHIDGKREVRKWFVVTSKNVILIDYFSYRFGNKKTLRVLDKIGIANIKTIKFCMKKIHFEKRAFLELSAENGRMFELSFHNLEDYTSQIDDIVRIFRAKNPDTNVVIDIKK